MNGELRYQLVMTLHLEAERRAAEQRLARKDEREAARLPSIRVSIRRALGLSPAA